MRFMNMDATKRRLPWLELASAGALPVGAQAQPQVEEPTNQLGSSMYLLARTYLVHSSPTW